MKNQSQPQWNDGMESTIQFSDIFNLDDIQKLQDMFADAHGVASVITTVDGMPITRPSNFCRLCKDIIRKTEIGKSNCFKSDKYIGCHNPSGPIVQTCLSGGLWDAGTSISVGGKHIASWLIGQVRNQELNEEQILQYAEKIGANREEFIEAFYEVPAMSMEQFNKVAKLVYAFATELSEKAYSNLQLKVQLEESKKTTALLKESEENYADIFNTVSEGIAHTTFSGKVLSVNNYLEQILEIPKEKIVGKNIMTIAKELLTVKNFKSIIPVIKSVLQGKNISGFQFEYKSKIFEITTTRNKNTQRITGVIRDITENKLAENKLKFSEERYRLIFENSPVGLLSYDANGVIVACNSSFADIIGTEQSKLIGLNMLQLPNKNMVSVIQKSLNGEIGLYEGVYHSVSSNKTSIGRALFAPIPVGDRNASGGVGIIEDISDRKQMEEALHVSEENYRLIFEHSPLGLISFNKDGEIVACNTSFSNIIGSSIERLTGLNMLNLPDQELVSAVRKSLIGMDGYYEGLYQSVTSTKSTPVRGLFSSVYLDGIVHGGVGIIEDITERKRTEDILRKSEEKYRVLVDNSFEGIVIIDLEGKILFANHSILKTFEYESLDEIVGQNIFSHVAPEYVAQTMEDFAKVVRGEDNQVAESCGITAKGKRIWMESVGKIIEYDGNVADLISVHDITAKKQAEERLAKLNDCFLKFESDSQANINRLVALCGELLGATCSLYNCIQGGMLNTISQWNTPAGFQKIDFPEGHLCYDVINSTNDKICVVNNLQDSIYAHTDPNVKKYNLKTYIGKAVRFNNQNIGSVCVVFQNDVPVEEDDLRIIELIASAIGVEEDRMRAAEAIKENEEKFRKTFYLSPDSVNINRFSDGMYVSVNTGFSKMSGYTEDEVIGKTSLEINIWDNPADRLKLIEGLLKNGSIENLEAVFRKKNGEKAYGLMSASVFNLNGILHIISITRDITERKKAEHDLLDSEAKFKAIANFSASWEAWFSPDGKLKWMNSYSNYLSGYTVEEYMAADDYLAMVIAPEDIDLAREKFTEAMYGGSGDNLELRVLRKDGSKFWVSISWRPILDSDGCTLGFRTSAQDITRRKQTEEIFKDIVEKNPLSIQILDLDGFTIQTNSAHTRLFGAKIPKEYSLFKDPELIAQGLGETFELIKKGEVVNLPDTLFNVHNVDPSFPDNPVWVKAKGFALNNSEGKPEKVVIMHENITDRKIAEKEMNKLRKAIDQSTDAIFMTDIQGIFTFANMGFTSTYGYTNEEIIGKLTPRVIKSGLMPNDIYDHFWDALLSGQEVKCELINKRKDGTLIQVEVIANAILDENGHIIGYIGIQRDITQRKLAEEALQKSEKFLKESQLIAQLGTYSFDVVTGLWESSEVLDSIFGIDEDFDRSITGWLSIIHPDCQTKMSDYFAHEVMRDGNNFNKEYKIKRINDSAERWVHGLGNLKFDEQGKLITMIGTIRDITEIKLAEENVRKIGNHYQALIEKAPDGIALIDPNGDFKFISPSAKRIFGYDLSEEFTGKPDELTHPDDLPYVLAELQKLLADPSYIPILQYRFFDGKGNWKWIESTFTNLYADQSVGAIVINFRDISERRKYEEELINAKEKAVESDRLKSAFLANMSHEIRTPMNGILGFADLLKEPELTGEQQMEYIRIIEKSGARMLNIINDIIDISKIESGAMKLYISETSIKEQLEFITTFFRPEAEKKGIILSCTNLLPANKTNIKTDREKLYAILTNLVKNAIKFTNSGSIEIGCSSSKHQDGTSLVNFYVKDSGIGIPTNRQRAIFDRFIQADIEDKQAFQGAGLGLAISKAFVEMLGGEIWVESEPGNGSVFYFTIRDFNELDKISSGENIEITNAEDHPHKYLKILIAEDDEGSEKLLSFAVNKFCKEIFKANTGSQAVEICKQHPDIDLILMDIQMPGVNGYDATRQIRQFNKDVIIIAQTAYALSGDRERAIESGCNDYLTKPIKKEFLINMINKYFEL